MSEQQTPPGWYADPQPSPPGGLRWWDGARWTPAVSAPAPAPVPYDPRPGWWRRAGAWAIDLFIVSAASWVVGLPVQLDFQEDLRVAQERMVDSTADGTGGGALATYWSDVVQAWTDRWVWLGLLPVLAALAYHLVLLRTRSATVGKLSLGLRVVPATGDDVRPSWSAVVRRALAQFGPGWLVLPLGLATGSVGTIALLFGLATVWQLLDHLWAAGSGRRALHDLVAGTRVVRAP